MSDSAETASFEAVPADAGQPVSTSAGAPPSTGSGAGAGNPAAEHPELLVGAAFVSGLVLAAILKRLAG